MSASSPSSTSASPTSRITLRQAYNAAQQKLKHLQTSTDNPADLHSQYTAALSSFFTLQSILSHAGILSANESLTELPASSLCYIMVEYDIGSIWQSWPGIEGRRKRVDRSIRSYMNFLSLCDQCEIFTPDETRQYNIIKTTVYAGEQDDTHTSKRSVDAAEQRMDKIARYKQRKELEKKIAAYEATRSQKTEAKRKSTKDRRGNQTNLEDKEDIDDDDDEDDDTLRQYWLWRIHLCIMLALEQIPLSLQELEFLKQRESIEEQTRKESHQPQQKEATAASSESIPTSHQPKIYTISDASQLNQPIPPHMSQYLQRLPQANIQPQLSTATSSSLAATSSRSAEPFDISSIVTTLSSTTRPTRETVFRDPNPATMNVEEWAEQEMKAGRLPAPPAPSATPILAQRHKNYIGKSYREGDGNEDEQNNRDESTIGEYGGEGDNAAHEQKVRADREWDNWKDDHEKGAGNRMK